MSGKPIQGNRKSKATSAPAPVQRLALFGRTLLLDGEDADAYDALHARICAAVEPVDIVEEMFVDDLIFLEWEVLRWRRLKSALLRARAHVALEIFLRPVLDYDLYAEGFEEYLTEILLKNLAESQSQEFAKELAHQCARNEPDAIDKVKVLLASAGASMDSILKRAKADKVEEIVQGFARREPGAVKQVNSFLDAAGRTMDDLIAGALVIALDPIERIDRLATIAETRRNASLREIDRRRAELGEVLRRSVQEIEDAEFKEIETTPAKGKSAA